MLRFSLSASLPGLAYLARSTAGLCVFCNERERRVYALPFRVSEKLVGGERYHLAPLVASLRRPHRFYILALSQNRARLVLVDDEVEREVVFDPETPCSLSEATPTVVEKQLQFHSGGSRSSGEAPAYHGQRPGERRKEEDLKRYLSRVAEDVGRIMAPADAPLVLAGVPELTAKFASWSRSRIAKSKITGNPDALSVIALAEQGRECVKPELAQAA